MPIALAASLLAATLAPLPAAVTRADVVAWVHADAADYGASVDELLAVGQCESQLEPFALGDGGMSFGPFQFHLRGIWWWTPAGRAGLHPSDARQNVRMAAWAFAQGAEWRRHWSCWRALYGGG